MRHFRTAVAVMAVAGWAVLAGVEAAAFAGEAATLAASIEAIRAAEDPAAALEAYQGGAAIDKNNLTLNREYLLRMLELGVPQNAYEQAGLIEKQAPTDGLALGVIGFVQAQRQNMPQAITCIILALQSMPDDPFLLRTAGQLAAWYDRKGDRPEIPQYIKEFFGDIRKQAAATKDFKEAYDEARQAYAELDAAELDDEGEQDLELLAVEPTTAEPASAYPTVVNVYNYNMYNDFLTQDDSYSDSVMSYEPAYDAWETVVDPTWYGWQGGPGGYRWHRDHVIFVGRIHDCGVTIGRTHGRDVIIDHARNVYIGHARNVYINHARKVVVNDARSVVAHKSGTLVARSDPATLVFDTKGVMEARTNRPFVGPRNPATVREGPAAIRTAPAVGRSDRPVSGKSGTAVSVPRGGRAIQDAPRTIGAANPAVAAQPQPAIADRKAVASFAGRRVGQTPIAAKAPPAPSGATIQPGGWMYMGDTDAGRPSPQAEEGRQLPQARPAAATPTARAKAPSRGPADTDPADAPVARRAATGERPAAPDRTVAMDRPDTPRTRQASSPARTTIVDGPAPTLRKSAPLSAVQVESASRLQDRPQPAARTDRPVVREERPALLPTSIARNESRVQPPDKPPTAQPKGPDRPATSPPAIPPPPAAREAERPAAREAERAATARPFAGAVVKEASPSPAGPARSSAAPGPDRPDAAPRAVSGPSRSSDNDDRKTTSPSAGAPLSSGHGRR